MPSRPAGRPSSSPPTQSGYRTAADLEAQGLDVAAIVDSRTDAPTRWAGKARIIAGGVVSGCARRQDAVGCHHCQPRLFRDDQGRCAGHVRRLEPDHSPRLPSRRRPVWSDAKSAFLAPERLDGLTLAGCCRRPRNAGGLPCRWRAEKPARSSRTLASAMQAPPLHRPPRRSLERRPGRLWFVRGVERQGLRRLPERRAPQGSRLGGQGRLWPCRACQALHHQRHGDRPGQAVQHQRHRHSGRSTQASRRPMSAPRPSGPSTRRVSFGALAGTSRGKHFQPVRKSPLHDWAKKHGAIFVETGLWYRSSWFPQGWRNDLARKRRSRGSECPRECRHLRRLDARQDRDLRQGRGRIPEPHLLQRLSEAAGRQGALRVDAARRRHDL